MKYNGGFGNNGIIVAKYGGANFFNTPYFFGKASGTQINGHLT
jgi:hypothetical protein